MNNIIARCSGVWVDWTVDGRCSGVWVDWTVGGVECGGWRGKFKDRTGQWVPFLGWDRTMGARFMSAPDNGACFSTGWKSVCVFGRGFRADK